MLNCVIVNVYYMDIQPNRIVICQLFCRKQHNDIRFLWGPSFSCYFWRGGCDWLKIFALQIDGNKPKHNKRHFENSEKIAFKVFTIFF
jgi:hypothetical protein